MIPKLANMKPVAKPNVPPRRRLRPAYTAREPMIKSTMPQMNRIGMNSSISRRLCTQVLLANSEIASRMWKPPSTNIISAAYVSQPGRLVVGVLSPLFHYFFLSLATLFASRICPLASCHGVRLVAEERRAHPLEGGLPLFTQNPRRGVLGNLACPV